VRAKERERARSERELGQGREGESSTILFIERKGERRGHRGGGGRRLQSPLMAPINERVSGGRGEENGQPAASFTRGNNPWGRQGGRAGARSLGRPEWRRRDCHGRAPGAAARGGRSRGAGAGPRVRERGEVG
jgi:hypothetical protein